jgi:hypothetical protein
MAGELGHVVIEHSDPLSVGEHAAALRAARFFVWVCDGPAFRPSGCPVVVEGRCSLIDGADLVVHLIDDEDPQQPELLTALRQSYLGTPVITAADSAAPEALAAAVAEAAGYLHRPARR